MIAVEIDVIDGPSLPPFADEVAGFGLTAERVAECGPAGHPVYRLQGDAEQVRNYLTGPYAMDGDTADELVKAGSKA